MWDFVSFLDCFAKAPLHRKIFSCRISADFNHCANRAQLLFTVCLQEKRCRGEVFMCYRTGMTLTLVSKRPPRQGSLRSPAAKGREGLVNALGHLTSHSLPFGIPSLARYVRRNRTFTIAHGGNTKAFLFKELKLFVQMIDSGEN